MQKCHEKYQIIGLYKTKFNTYKPFTQDKNYEFSKSSAEHTGGNFVQ
jgi:hypothetical protein